MNREDVFCTFFFNFFFFLIATLIGARELRYFMPFVSILPSYFFFFPASMNVFFPFFFFFFFFLMTN